MGPKTKSDLRPAVCGAIWGANIQLFVDVWIHISSYFENYSIFRFFRSRAQKGREYSRWIDLKLGIHFEAVIPESCRTKVHFKSKPMFWNTLNVGIWSTSQNVT